MNATILARLFEHNHWANLQLIAACARLTPEQLDREPQTATRGSIRRTLQHLIHSQEDYLAQLEGRELHFDWQTAPEFEELQRAAVSTGEGLIALARNETNPSLNTKFERDGYSVEPWVVMLQAINHATEHREQIKSMLNSLDITPPHIDGWAYGMVTEALIELSA